MKNKPVIIVGAGGHASVLIDLLYLTGRKILGFLAPDEAQIIQFPELEYLGDDSSISKFSTEKILLVNGIGSTSVSGNLLREKIFRYYKQKGYLFETLVHPTAFIAPNTKVGEGAQIMAGSIIQTNTIIRSNVIVNTRVSIDHDCEISHSVHIAPGCTLSGQVKIGSCAFLGVGSIVIQSICISENSMIRAGEIIVKDVR